MTISQISVFAESKPGHLARVLKIMESVGVNVRGFSVSDTGEFGITRFIVDKPTLACEALEKAGSAFVVSEVLCIKLIDEPGELARVMGVLAANNENVLYSYSMISTYIVVATENIQKTESLLANEPIEMISQADIERICEENR